MKKKIKAERARYVKCPHCNKMHRLRVFIYVKEQKVGLYEDDEEDD